METDSDKIIWLRKTLIIIAIGYVITFVFCQKHTHFAITCTYASSWKLNIQLWVSHFHDTLRVGIFI